MIELYEERDDCFSKISFRLVYLQSDHAWLSSNGSLRLKLKYHSEIYIQFYLKLLPRILSKINETMVKFWPMKIFPFNGLNFLTNGPCSIPMSKKRLNQRWTGNGKQISLSFDSEHQMYVTRPMKVFWCL